MTHRRTTALLAAALLAAGVGLTGCAGGAAGASTQTVKQACAVIGKSSGNLSSSLSAATSKAATDPTGAADNLDKVKASFDKAAAKVTNTKVKKQVTAASTALGTFDDEFRSYAKNPQGSATTKLQSAAEKVQTTFTTLGTTCS